MAALTDHDDPVADDLAVEQQRLDRQRHDLAVGAKDNTGLSGKEQGQKNQP